MALVCDAPHTFPSPRLHPPFPPQSSGLDHKPIPPRGTHSAPSSASAPACALLSKTTATPTSARRSESDGLTTQHSSHAHVSPSKSTHRAIRQPRRVALLVGIQYTRVANDDVYPLEGPYRDVDAFRELLIDTYGYRDADVTVMKDDPDTSYLLQPTELNIRRELQRLVHGAAPGDQFTLAYSGHSDQQATTDDQEEDDQDEVLITSDLKRIVDNELKKILVDPLPAGCSLTAFFDSCHSGTMLDLPHHHCNAIYVPWQSKGARRTKTMHANTTRRNAGIVVPVLLPSIESAFERRASSHPTYLTEKARLQINTRSLDDAQLSRGNCPFEEGWEARRPSIVSLSSCSDAQRSWEGPEGSMSVIVCDYLKEHPTASYKDLMTHVNFTLHKYTIPLHKWTVQAKKAEARGLQPPGSPPVDGEKDNFQTPELSSLVRLNMDDSIRL
ncbi:hypothetical protein BV25DRAFT_1914435 [Artomyces pyxidatus]|uniref:Uncharacterized protein n=1 Tax=Artomyces pyxidatus TaxID=48021 RepID=A0ACB8T627_9AGAM|nr:hypothetical protein BV25DRAFT_1914435 [Artomyces pyxidatus]